MNGSQQIVGLGGMGLIAVNFWTGTQRSEVVPIITGGGSVASAHSAFKELGAELLFVVIATVLAGVDGGWGTGLVAVIVGLFILWGINYYGKPHPAKTSAPSTSTTTLPTVAA